MAKRTEKTWRKSLIDALEKRLIQYGMCVYEELSFRTVDGYKHRIPDILILDASKKREEQDEIIILPSGIVSIIETESVDIHAGVLQALRYVTDLQFVGAPRNCFSTNYKSIIAIIFEDTLRRIDDETFGVSVTAETISSVADFITNVLVGIKVAPPIEQKDLTIIKLLDASVSQLALHTAALPKSKLEHLTGMFFAKTLNPSLMKDATLRKEFGDVVARAASYLIVNQIFFYHLLSSEIDAYKPLSEVKDPEDIQKLFDIALDGKYEPIFGARIVGLLPKSALPLLNNIINAIKSLKLEQVRRDIIGKVFNNLLPEAIRKRIAAYYTKNSAAELLAKLCIKKEDDTVIDLACGSGTLLVAPYRRKKELYLSKKESVSSAELHRKLLSQIYGVDICLFAAHLAAVHLSLQEVLAYTERVIIQVEDAFNILPGYHALPLDIIMMGKVVVEGRPLIPPVDVVIMNPPFTGIERMERKYIKFLDSVMKKEGKLDWVGGRGAGLHIYFLLHADGFLKKGGRLAAVLPESLLTYVQTVGVPQFLAEHYAIDYIISSDAEIAFSEQTDFKEILLMARKRVPSWENAKFVTLKVPLTIGNASAIAEKLESVTTDYEDSDIRVRLVAREQLKKPVWIRFLRPIGILEEIENLAGDRLVTGAQIFGRAMEGLRPLGVNFFYIPNKYWGISTITASAVEIKNKYTGERIKFPKKYLVRSLRMPKKLAGLISPKLETFLVTIPDRPMMELPSAIQKYITWGMKSLEKDEIPAIENLGFGWFSHIWSKLRDRGKFKRIALLEKFLPTTKGVAAHLFKKSIPCVGPYYFIDAEDQKAAAILAAWFNSTVGLVFRYRHRAILGKASERLLGQHIDNMPCLNVFKLNKGEVNVILRALDAIRKQEPLPPVSEQLGHIYREKLDKAILKSLGVRDDKIDDVLERLQNVVRAWVSQIESRR